MPAKIQGQYVHVFAYCVPRKDHKQMLKVMTNLSSIYASHGCQKTDLYVWGETSIFQGFAGLHQKLGATPNDELWLEVDSYSSERDLRKVVESVGKDRKARPLWGELTEMVGPGRSIAMGEFERMVP